MLRWSVRARVKTCQKIHGERREEDSPVMRRRKRRVMNIQNNIKEEMQQQAGSTGTKKRRVEFFVPVRFVCSSFSFSCPKSQNTAKAPRPCRRCRLVFSLFLFSVAHRLPVPILPVPPPPPFLPSPNLPPSFLSILFYHITTHAEIHERIHHHHAHASHMLSVILTDRDEHRA